MPRPISRRSLSLLATAALLTLQAAAADAPAPDAKPADKPKWDVNHPPGPKATVDIDTHTGTWMTVDVSPDGQRLVFDLLGDLYTLPIAGGEATPLTHSIAWEMQARWSPDDRRIAYISDAGESQDDALNALKHQKALGAISVKSYNQPRHEQRQQILEAARQTDMMVVPEGGSLFELNMTMVVDGHTGVEHALPVANAYDDVKQLWGQTQVGYTPTYNVAYGGLDGEHYFYAMTEVWRHPILKDFVPRSVLEERAVRREIAPEEDYNVIQVARTATGLLHAGVRENLGAHGQREGLGAHWDMWMQVKGGMTPLEAIRNSTLNGAHYLGMDKDIGSLEVGKLADLVVIDGDPTVDIRQSDRVVDVMQNGRLYSLPRLDEIAPRQKPRAPLFFDGTDGAAMPVSTHGHGHGDMEGDD